MRKKGPDKEAKNRPRRDGAHARCRAATGSPSRAHRSKFPVCMQANAMPGQRGRCGALRGGPSPARLSLIQRLQHVREQIASPWHSSCVALCSTRLPARGPKRRLLHALVRGFCRRRRACRPTEEGARPLPAVGHRGRARHLGRVLRLELRLEHRRNARFPRRDAAGRHDVHHLHLQLHRTLDRHSARRWPVRLCTARVRAHGRLRRGVRDAN